MFGNIGKTRLFGILNLQFLKLNLFILISI